MALGNLILARSILFSGSSPAKAVNLLNHCKIQSFCLRRYNNIQALYLLPAIDAVWQREHDVLLRELQGHGVKIAGDGRCCSPGHTAKYGSYTIQDLTTNKVLDMELVQSNEVANSNTMELEGLIRCLQVLDNNNVSVTHLVTDRHPQVKKYMRQNKPDVVHQFDVWHVAKGIKKKVETASKKKGCGILLDWSHSTSNHLYFCAAFSMGNEELLATMWTSLMNHIVDEHEGHGELFPKCLHEPLDDRNWLQKGSKPHKELKEVLEKKMLLTDTKKLSQAEQTYGLEAFHKICCFFATKFVHFFFLSMDGRLKIACLHFNENGAKAQSTRKDGTPQWSISRPKYNKGKAVVKQVKDPVTYDCVHKLMEEIVERRRTYFSYRVAKEDLTARGKVTPPPVSSKYPDVDREAVIRAHRSRFNKN